jgi:hypothetical protein
MPKSFALLSKEDDDHKADLEKSHPGKVGKLFKALEDNKAKFKAAEAEYKATKDKLEAELRSYTKVCSTCNRVPVGWDRGNCACCIDDMRG